VNEKENIGLPCPFLGAVVVTWIFPTVEALCADCTLLSVLLFPFLGGTAFFGGCSDTGLLPIGGSDSAGLMRSFGDALPAGECRVCTTSGGSGARSVSFDAEGDGSESDK